MLTARLGHWWNSLPGSTRSSWICAVILCCVVLVVYGQTLTFDFVNYDDDELIYHSGEFLSQWKNLITVFRSHAFVSVGGESVYYRPLLLVSFIFEYHVWGINPFGFHLTNVLLHVGVVLILFHLVRRLFQDATISLFAALVFALHPIQTESVAWIAGRNDVLLGLFVISMIFFYVRYRQNGEQSRDLLFASVAFALAIFTKEPAAFYALLLPLYDTSTGAVNKKDFFSVRYLKTFWLIGIVVVLYVITRVSIFGEVIGAEKLYGRFTVLERLSRMPAIVAEHLRLLIAPIHLSVAHPVESLIWVRSPWNVVAVGIMVGFVFLLVWLRRADRIVWFGLVWLCVGLLPVLGLIPVPLPLLEHRLYTPLAGFALLVAGGLSPLLARSTIPVGWRALPWAVCGILAVVSFVRLPVWSNGVTLFTDAVRKEPNDLRSYFSLATAFYQHSQHDSALVAIRRYVALAPDDPRGYVLWREINYAMGNRQEVARLSKTLIRLEPRNPLRFLETGVIYEELNSLDSARLFYYRGLDLDSTNPNLHFRLGVVYHRRQQCDSSIVHYRKTIRFSPRFAEAYLNLAKCCVRVGDPAEAIRVLEDGQRTTQLSTDALELLHELYVLSANYAKAAELIRQRPLPK